MPNLIVFSGLPGVGKTTIAKALAKRLGIFLLRIDTIEQAHMRSMHKPNKPGDVGYLAAYALAKENLALGNSVIADAVHSHAFTREAWRSIADETNAGLLMIKVICSDVDVHRRRVETRSADIEGHVLPKWQDVQGRQWEPLENDHLVIDSGQNSVESSISVIMRHISQSIA